MIGITTLLIVLTSGLFAFYGPVRNVYADYKVRRLLTAAESQRPAGGRLYDASYSLDRSDGNLNSEIGQAQRWLLIVPDSAARRELQSWIHLASGNWAAAVEMLEELSRREPRDPAVLNNLGVAYMAAGQTESAYLFKALDQFELAAGLEPRAPEPRFNLSVLYRTLGLKRPAEAALAAYAEVDPSSEWTTELGQSPRELDEARILAELRQAVAQGQILEASGIVEQYPDVIRRIAMQYAFRSMTEAESVVRFIADEFAERYGDHTLQAMLEPLFSENGERLLAARQMVNVGAEFYLQGNLAASLDAYGHAERLVHETDSVFDRYWIDLNRVDTQVRLAEFETAKRSLENIIAGARERNLRWLLARALSVYGSAHMLSSGHQQMMDSLTEAEAIFVALGAPNDTVRPLYYLAVYTNGAGDYDESLRLAFKCLRLTDDADSLRKASLHWLIASVLYRKGLPERAAMFAAESFQESERTGNPGAVAIAASTLAHLLVSTSQHVEAEHYLAIAEEALGRIHASMDRMRAELPLNLVKARAHLQQQRYGNAENLLRDNLKIHSRLPFNLAPLHVETLMLLARVLSETQQIDEAREVFQLAIEVAESTDDYLQAEKLRIAFDDVRRELYDSAIRFEESHGETDAAWNYLQRYRAKMFLEFLIQFNPDLERTEYEALSRSRVQRRIPKDAQVIEYVLLDDRLLIWIASRRLFESRSVPVGRAAVEKQVELILGKLRRAEDTKTESGQLYAWLIAPIAGLLEAGTILAIVPDGALHGLPFAAIQNPHTGKYLIQEYPIQVSPSLTYLVTSPASKPSRDSLTSFGAQNGDITSVRELTSLRDLYGEVTTFMGQQVDKPSFLQAMETAPVFHYAGHSARDATDPLRSSILLDGARGGPNSVTAVDIAARRTLPNALVVLSSCDSSVGNSRDGVGMRGLTSAFLIGGAGAVVGSLWPVEAMSTSKLMVRFHGSFVAAGTPIAHALREAQLSFLQSESETSHPYYWSGFVVTGNFSAIE